MSHPIKAILQRPLLGIGLGPDSDRCATNRLPTAPLTQPAARFCRSLRKFHAAAAPRGFTASFARIRFYDLLTQKLPRQRNRLDVHWAITCYKPSRTRDPGFVETRHARSRISFAAHARH